MGNIQVSNSIVVNAPIEDVFEKFNDPQKQTEWMVDPGENRHYSPPLALGKSWETVSQFMGRNLVADIEVLELDVPHLCRFRMKGMMSGEIQHSCNAVDDGVRVTIDFDGDTSGFFASLASPLLKGQIDKRMQADLESFKQFIES